MNDEGYEAVGMSNSRLTEEKQTEWGGGAWETDISEHLSYLTILVSALIMHVVRIRYLMDGVVSKRCVFTPVWTQDQGGECDYYRGYQVELECILSERSCCCARWFQCTHLGREAVS